MADDKNRAPEEHQQPTGGTTIPTHSPQPERVHEETSNASPPSSREELRELKRVVGGGPGGGVVEDAP